MYERPKIETYRPGDVRRYAHLKRDGIMVTVVVDGAADVKCFTRHPDGAHQVHLDLDPINLLNDAVSLSTLRLALFCELYAPGQPASQVKSYLANGRCRELLIECFAIPSQSANISLEALQDYCTILRFPFAPFIELDENFQDPAAQAIQDWERQCAPDSEGIVFKDSNLKGWLKWKPVLTADLVVLGFEDGRGKYLGTLGSLVLGLYDGTEICHCSGMDDATRDHISEHEDEWLGKVVEVAYQRKDSGGGLRHPRFVRLREDKGAEECRRI